MYRNSEMMSTFLWANVLKTLQTEANTKCIPFCRRYQIHFLVQKLLYFDSNFTGIHSQWSNWQEAITASDDGFALPLYEAIDDGPIFAYMTFCLGVLIKINRSTYPAWKQMVDPYTPLHANGENQLLELEMAFDNAGRIQVQVDVPMTGAWKEL